MSLNQPVLSKIEDVLAPVILEFDAKAEAFGEYEICDKMRFVLGNRVLSDEEREVFYGESNAFFFRGRMDDDDPFSGYFQPTFGLPRSDGSTEWTPDPKYLTPAMIARWRNHLGLSKHAILRARYSDLLWSFQKSIEGVASSIETARAAVDAYIESSTLAGAANKNAPDWLARSIGLAASIGDSVRIDQAADAAFHWVDANGRPNMPGTWVFLFHDIYENKRVGASHKTRVISYLESVLTKTSDSTGESFDHFSSTTVSELLATHYRRRGETAEVERVIRKAGTATEFAAAQASPLLALAWLQPLMERYRDAAMNEDVARVQVEGRRRGAASREDMKSQSYSFEIPKEEVQKYLQFLKDPASVPDRMRRWAISNVQDAERAKQSLIETLTQTPLLARIGITAISDGHYVAKTGSVEDDMDGRLAAHLRQLLQLNSQLFVGSWFELVNAGGLDADSVLALIKGSPAFDQTGVEMIAEGLQRFFAEDHLAATHILIPQVERALRTILGLLGRPTNKIIRGEKGTMQEQNMNEILADAAMKELLPISWQRHLQVVFSSRLGFNLRNVVAHGLLSANEFSVYTSLLTLQGLFILAQVEATGSSESSAPENAHETPLASTSE